MKRLIAENKKEDDKKAYGWTQELLAGKSTALDYLLQLIQYAFGYERADDGCNSLEYRHKAEQYHYPFARLPNQTGYVEKSLKKSTEQFP